MRYSANEVKMNLLNAKGQFVSARWRSDVGTSAQFKAFKLHKVTEAVVRSGINYANLTSVKEGIANGERNAVGVLPWGVWIDFPYIIGHNGNTYIRLYASINHIPKVTYFVNDVPVSKAIFVSFLTPSKAKELMERSEPMECFTVNSTNILDIL